MTVNRRIQPYTIFILLWLVINILQSAFTELTSDEGYYWFYSRALEWGYYDHPPMVALMIRIGGFIFKGELGVRIINVLFSTGALILFFRLLPKDLRNNAKVFLLLLSCPLLNYLGFIVFPDGPLLFFSLLFLYYYKKFIEKQGWNIALQLGICMALMFYSKYHGILVVFFTVLAHLRLLSSKYFYFSALIALLLFLPHISWQIHHHFVTLGYHLSGRTDPVSLNHVFEYISQQIPALGLGLVFIPFVYKPDDLFERTLKYIIVGSFSFFLVSSLKTFVHFHWTSITLFPLLLLAAKYYTNEQRKKLFNWLIVPFVILIILIRLQLMFTILPVNHANVDYYKGRDLWASDIKKIAANRPVLFANNLREASLYSFYSGKMAVTIYGRQEKKTQYDLWNYEDSLQNKEILFLTQYPFPGDTQMQTRMGQMVYYRTIPSFRSYYDHLPITCKVLNTSAINSAIKCSVTITNERNYTVLFGKNYNGDSPVLTYSLENMEGVIQADTLKIFSAKDQLLSGSKLDEQVKIDIKNIPSGQYRLLFGIRFGIIPEAFNSNELSVSINK